MPLSITQRRFRTIYWLRKRIELYDVAATESGRIDDVFVAWAANGGPIPVITSGNDGRHNSLHFSELAVDLRAYTITDTLSARIGADSQSRLGDDYDVIFESLQNNPANDHINVEYDPN